MNSLAICVKNLKLLLGWKNFHILGEIGETRDT